MNSATSWTRWLILVLVLMTGCTGKSASTGSSGEDGSIPAPTADAKAKKNLVPIKRDVKEIAGNNWVVVITSKRTDSYRWIIRFTRGADGKITGETVDSKVSEGETEKPELTETEVNGDAVRLVFKSAKLTMDFVGTFQKGFIRGTMRAGPVEVYPTRLLPIDAKSLETFGAIGLPPGTDRVEEKMKSKDLQPEHLLEVASEYRESPVALDIYSMLMMDQVRTKFNEAKVKEVITAFLSSAKLWGERWEARAEMTIAVSLIKGGQFVRLAPPHLDAAEQKFGEDRATFQPVLNEYRSAANVAIQIQDLTSPSTTEEVRLAANTALMELLKKQRYNPDILLALATYAERTGNVDGAIEYLSDIVALPMLEGMIMAARAGQPPDTPTPGEHLKKLWTTKTGSEDGYLKHISDVHRARIEEYLAEIQKNGPPPSTAEAGNKTVLVELFTGMMCPPCVGADLALSAIGKAYPTSKVIVLRYHQHIPKPDGLVNQDSEERAAFYEISGTPTIVVDGMTVDTRFYAGMMQSAPGGYGVLRQVLDASTATKTDVALQASASVTDGQLTVSVEATGIPEEVLPSCRLRMAIAENEVSTDGPMAYATNGIRIHEFVVREMPGGSKGIPPKKGELKYSLTMPIADLQQHVIDHIGRFEAGRRLDFPSEMKPAIKGPLSLVAWVQNSNPDPQYRAKLVMQAVQVAVTGDTGFGQEGTTTTKTDDSKTPATTGTKSETMPAKAQKSGSDSAVKAEAAVVKGDAEGTPPPPALPE